MLEKKRMGYVDFAYPQFDAKLVDAVVDGDTGEVMIYRPGDDCVEWQKPNEYEHFFPTLDDAADALGQRKRELHAMMKNVRHCVESLNNWRSKLTKDDPLYFEEEDYLPADNLRSKASESYWRKRYEDIDKENSYLVGIIRTGFVNIHGQSFRLDDVIHVKWGKDKAELILTGDRKVVTGNKYEFSVVARLFGANVSGIVLERLSKKEEEKG